AVPADFGAGEPDLRAVRRPRETLRRREGLRPARLLPREVYDDDRASVVVRRRMVVESDPASVGRDPQVAHPGARLVENLANWDLDPHAFGDASCDRETLPVRSPVGPLDFLQDLPWRRPAGD